MSRQTRDIQVQASFRAFSSDFQFSNQPNYLRQSSASSRPLPRQDGCSIQKSSRFSEPETPPTGVPPALPGLRSSLSGPFHFWRDCVTAIVHHQIQANSGRWSICLPLGLEQMKPAFISSKLQSKNMQLKICLQLRTFYGGVITIAPKWQTHS